MRNDARFWVTNVTLAAFAALACLAVDARSQSPTQSGVTPTSYQRDVPSTTPQSVQFVRRASQVGDQHEQSLTFDLELHQIMRQGQNVIEQAEMTTHRAQRRQVTTTEVDAGTSTAALVRYPEATIQIISAATPDELKTLTAPTAPEPVQDKAYRCRRQDGTLDITDEQGKMPPLDEYKTVAQNMASLGRVNPLAEYLAGRTLTVGERISLPGELGDRLLGLGQELGHVTRFDLALAEVRTVDGAACAVFTASIDAASTGASQMRMQVDGPLVVQATGCRAVEAHLSGPFGLSETRGSLTEQYQMSGTGRISVGIRTVYRDVEL
jgi:hypothetical protein